MRILLTPIGDLRVIDILGGLISMWIGWHLVDVVTHAIRDTSDSERKNKCVEIDKPNQEKR